ncbi:MAG: NACHT domain-containing protein, partial [Phaeodactylibacter sp.]|nr:NACHT domain-containing protein [Phaeodactylibacter sp.]
MSTIESILNQFKVPATAFVAAYGRISRTLKKYESLNYTELQGCSNLLLYERVDRIFQATAPHNNVAILGEFGTGKTAFAYNYLYRTLKSWLNGESPFLPLIFRFRNYRNAPSFYDWLSEELLVSTGLDLDKRTIIKLIQSNQLLLILDGLDELPKSNDRHVINTVLSAINKLATMRSPLMLTCRTNFFPAVFEEATALHKFERLYIRELSDVQIHRIVGREFLTQPGDAATFMKNLADNPVIAELARRPLFLSMLIALFQPDQRLSIKNIAELYYKLTSAWLAAESLKGSSILDANDRRTILQELAFHQLLKGEFSSSYADLRQELPAIVRQMPTISPTTPVPAILKEISNYSLLDRREKDQFTFAHKSFQEYFIAEKLAQELVQEQYDNFGKRALQEEIFEFLSMMLENQNRLQFLEKGLLNRSIYFVARGNLIPVMRKGLKTAYIPPILEVFLQDESPLLRFMCGYTLSSFQQRFPSYFDKPE